MQELLLCPQSMASTLPFYLSLCMVSWVLLVNWPLDQLPSHASALDNINSSLNAADRVPYAIALSLLVGIIQLGMGVLKLGFVVRFLSNSVIAGFTGASAIVIGLTQARQVLGIPDLTRSNFLHVILEDIIFKIGKTQWQAVVITICTYIPLYYLPKIKQFSKLPIALIVLSAGTLVSYLAEFKSYKISVVETIPATLPDVSVPNMKLSFVTHAFTIAVIAFLESTAVSQALAMRSGYKIDASQELVAIGSSNIVGSFFSSFPTTGSFSRSAVQAQSGSQTPLTGLMVGILMLISIVSIAPALYHLPQACLAALILAAVYKLLVGAITELKHMASISPRDAVVGAVTFLCTLFLGVEDGILTGFGISLLLVIQEASFPHFAVLGKLVMTESNLNSNDLPVSANGDVVDVSPRVANVGLGAIQESQVAVVLDSASGGGGGDSESVNSQQEHHAQEIDQLHSDTPESQEKKKEENYRHSNIAFRNILRFPHAQQDPKIHIFRFDSSLFFANVQHFLDSIHSSIAARSNSKDIKFLILDCSAINTIDYAGVQTIMELQKELASNKSQPMEIVFNCVQGPVEDMLNREPSTKMFLATRSFHSLEKCMDFCQTAAATFIGTQIKQ